MTLSGLYGHLIQSVIRTDDGVRPASTAMSRRALLTTFTAGTAARTNRVIRNQTRLEARLTEFDSHTNTLVHNTATAMIAAKVRR